MAAEQLMEKRDLSARDFWNKLELIFSESKIYNVDEMGNILHE